MSGLILAQLPSDIIRDVVLPYLTLHDVMNLDNAVSHCNALHSRLRAWENNLYLPSLHTECSSLSNKSLRWCIKRNLCMKYICLQPEAKADIFMDIAQFVTALEHLRICRNSTPSVASFEALARGCPRLVSLALQECRAVSDRHLVAIAKHFPHLRYISLWSCSSISSKDIELLVSNCHQLETIEFCYVACDDACLFAIAAHCPYLTKLNLTTSSGTSLGIAAIAQGCSQLQWLCLYNCTLVDDGGLVAITRCCKRLVYLEVSGCGIALSDGQHEQVFFHYALPNLQSLSFPHCSWVTDITLQLLPECCPGIRHLNLQQCNISEQALATCVSSYPHLSYLDAEGVSATYILIDALALYCPQLRHLHVTSHGIPDEIILDLVDACSHLTVLELGDRLTNTCDDVIDDDLINMIKAKRPLLNVSRIYNVY